jgi:hypothetical protein
MPIQNVGAALEYLEKKYGGQLRDRAFLLEDLAQPQEVISFSGERVFLFMMNVSSAEIWVLPRRDVSNTRGMRLVPNGGFIAFSVEEDAIMPCLDWYAWPDTPLNHDLWVLEIRRDVTLPGETR